MKPVAILGVVLIVLGIAALAYQGFSYTSREQILDIGPIQASADTEKTVGIPPIVGGAAVLIGVVMLVAGGRKNP